jgi:glycosyltransferase involved in cell wall biosynthesis
MIRIAFWVSAGNKYGSLEKYIALFAERCKERGHEFLLINEIENTSTEYLHRLEKAGAAQVVVGESLQDTWMVFSKTVRVIKKWKPDVVDLFFVNSLAVPLLKSARVRLVYHTYLSGIDHPISLRTRLLCNLDNIFATRVFGNSERVRRDEIRAGISPNRIQTMYLGIPLDDFEGTNFPLRGRPPIGWNDPDIKKVISVGRFSPVKGVRYVVEAAIQVIKLRDDVVWWLVGQDGPESAVCRSLIRAAKLDDRIDCLIQRNDITALLKNSYMQVVGSLSEGLPFTILEASACGIPTIGTRIGGMDEAILDGITGILVPRYSGSALAEASLHLLEDRQLREQMGQAARSYINQHFDAEILVGKLLDMYEEDLAEKS